MRARAAEDALTVGYDEGNGKPRRESGSDAARFSLTRQEMRVLRLLPGLTNRQIAEHLRSSPETVKTQVSAVLRKLKAHDRAHAVAIGMSTGIIPDRFGADKFGKFCVTRQPPRACEWKEEGDGE